MMQSPNQAVPIVEMRTTVQLDELLDLHVQTCDCALRTMKRKNHDYTVGSGDPFANFRMCKLLNIDPRLGLLIRVMDKIKRMQTFIDIGSLEVNESFNDAIEDVINYMILLKGLNIDTERTERSSHP